MKLPNGHRAVIDVGSKLAGYCLNMDHARGRHKARVFQAALGIAAADPTLLVKALREAALSTDATFRKSNGYGNEYEIEFPMDGPNGRFVVTSAWFIDRESDLPRLTNCYVNLTKSRRFPP